MSQGERILNAAKLSDAVYEKEGAPAGWKVILDARSESSDSGFDAAAYYSEGTGELYIIYRGTELVENGGGDRKADTDLGKGVLNSQFYQAHDFYEAVALRITDSNRKVNSITIAGHSLGGALATYVGVQTGQPTIAFNAPGIAQISEAGVGDSTGYNNIINIRSTNDPVSMFGDLVGQVVDVDNAAGKLIFNLGMLDDFYYLYSQHSMGDLNDAIKSLAGKDPDHLDEYYYNPDDGRWYAAKPTESNPNWLDPASEIIQSALTTERSLIVASRGLINLWLDNLTDSVMSNMKSLFEKAEVTRSPLVLDLDGDGVETLSPSNIHFDHDGNGFAEATGWVGKDDGLLVLDKNQNGQIENGSELFGNSTDLSSGQEATNGFLALADLDENKDGIIDSKDSAYSVLRVWHDTNSDGVAQEGELLTLAEAKVESLNTGYSEPGALDANGNVPSSVVDSNGNEHRQVGSYTRTDGTVAAMEDVWFATDTSRTIDTNLVDVPDDISGLPDIAGFGDVHSLHQAMARDASGTLKALVESFAAESDASARKATLIDIIYYWAGVEDIDPASRAATQIYGNVIGDARKLATLEKFLGESYLGTWCWGERDPNPHGPAAAILLQAFDNLAGVIYSKLMLQTHFSPLLQGLQIELNETGITWNTSAIVAALKSQYDADQSQGTVLMAEFANGLKVSGTFGKDLLADMRAQGDGQGSGFFLLLSSLGLSSSSGSAGNDVLNGTSQDDYLWGLGGNDRLYGGGGDDHLSGGLGNDYLAGGDGADIYEFNRGDGADTILNADQDEFGTKLDKLVFGAGISVSDVFARRSFYDLVLGVIGTSDSVTIQSFFDEDTVANHGYAVDQIVFSDGTIWTVDQVKSLVQQSTDGNDALYGYATDDRLAGSAGDDMLYGYGGSDTLDGGIGNDTLWGGNDNDVLDGGDGNDYLYGGTGDDSLEGGAGNDVLRGDTGSDVYRFGRGRGQDMIYNDDTGSDKVDAIEFDADIAPGDILLTRSGSNLVLLLAGSTDKVTVSGFFTSDGTSAYKLEEIRFADGTIWDVATVKRLALLGTAGNDSLTGYASDDLISAGEGNDVIYGNDGNDQLFGESGDDRLDGGAGNDILNGGLGDDYLSGGEGSDVYQFGRGYGQDRINNSDRSEGSQDVVQLENGVAMSDVRLTRNESTLILTILDTGDRLNVEHFFESDAQDGYQLDRIVFADGGYWDTEHIKQLVQLGSSGDDSLYGYAGNDILSGEDGNDSLYGYEGDDHLSGGVGNDWIQGDTGDDVLLGNAGEDYLSGGAGSNLIDGGEGNDTYWGGSGTLMSFGLVVAWTKFAGYRAKPLCNCKVPCCLMSFCAVTVTTCWCSCWVTTATGLSLRASSTETSPARDCYSRMLPEQLRLWISSRSILGPSRGGLWQMFWWVTRSPT